MKKALIGYGGHAREVMAQMGMKLTCFVDDKYITHDANAVPLSLFNYTEYVVMVAIADSKDRYDIIQRLPEKTKYFTWVHPTAIIMDDTVEIGDGSFIGAYSILTTNIKIGKHAILNRANHIGHDCKIGNYFSAMPGTIISGNQTIGDRVYFGTGSCIKQKLTVCDDVVIGMNSGVTKNITEPGTYIGTPAKI